MIATRSFDAEKITAVVLSMISDVVEDDTNDSCFDVDTDQDCWLELNEGNVFYGYMHVSAYNRTTLDIHPYILKSQRKKSIQCGKTSLKWVDDNAPIMYRKLISQVPSIYPHIKKYTELLGFTHEGTYKNSFTKNGQRHDLWLFGIERQIHDHR